MCMVVGKLAGTLTKHRCPKDSEPERRLLSKENTGTTQFLSITLCAALLSYKYTLL